MQRRSMEFLSRSPYAASRKWWRYRVLVARSHPYPQQQPPLAFSVSHLDKDKLWRKEPVSFICSFRSVSSSTKDSSCSSMASPSSSGDSGIELYHKYLKLQEEWRKLQEEKERKKSQHLFHIWSQQQQQQQSPQQSQPQESKKNDKQAAVQVIRALAKVTRKEQQQRQQQQDSDSSKDDELQQQSQQVLEQAALQYHHAEALVTLANQKLHQLQQTTAPQEEQELLLQEVLNLYSRATNSKEALFNLGHLYWTGYTCKTRETDDTFVLLPVDTDKAMTYFRQAMSAGDLDAMYFVGVQLVDHDKQQEGLEWIQRAANGGHGGALYYLALWHYNNTPNDTMNERLVRTLLDQAVEAGDVEATYLRGHFSLSGEFSGYPQDYKKAFDDFWTAAHTGEHAAAAVCAGAMLHQGYPPAVPRNYEEAFQCYQLAAEYGSMDGWRNVVACYVAGDGVPQNLELARYITETVLQQQNSNDDISPPKRHN